MVLACPRWVFQHPNIFNGGYDYHSKFEWNTVQNLVTSLEYVKHLVFQWGEENLTE